MMIYYIRFEPNLEDYQASFIWDASYREDWNFRLILQELHKHLFELLSICDLGIDDLLAQEDICCYFDTIFLQLKENPRFTIYDWNVVCDEVNDAGEVAVDIEIVL